MVFQQGWTYQLVVTVVMKNCEPLVSEPAFAIDNSPGNHVRNSFYMHEENRE